jgi:phage terminase Nu1 subunit (DNA packaging protein)
MTELLNTLDVLARLESDLNRVYDRRTITNWTCRADNPLPLAFKGTRGQGNKYDYDEVLAWLMEEDARQALQRRNPDEEIDYHTARTIEQRERAKQKIIETGVMEGKYGEIQRMQAAAEDLGRQAVQELLNIAPRLSPKLATIADEVEIDQLLQTEIRAICNKIAAFRPSINAAE